jgi:hypothetical protein
MAKLRTARSWRTAFLAVGLAWGCAAPAPKAPPVPAQPSFADLFNRLSEPGGYFDSDNLISNETSYLHALDLLRARMVRGGAYIGVGPDQNFSYIAEIKPEVAFMIDIRRDNMLQHLMFRSLFQRSRNRMEYLAGLTGAQVANVVSWTGKPIEQIAAVLDTAQRTHSEFTRWSTIVIQDALATGIALTADDLATLQRFHLEFHQLGLNIRYSSKNRPTRLAYPTLGQLILERDRTGALGSYLATEERWRVVQDMHKRDRILFVTGDLAGPHALRAIGTYITQLGLRVTAFYTSNVEQYLFQYGSFERFAANTVLLPFADNGVIIRSFFNRGGGHPAAVPGHISVQLVQPAAEFVSRSSLGGYTSYFELTGLVN